MTATDQSFYTPVPEPIAQAWRILAATAFLLDPPFQPKLHDLTDMLTIGEAMDTLVDVTPRYPPITLGDHAPHTPAQAASCALAHLNAYRPTAGEETTRVRQVQRLLAPLTDRRRPGPDQRRTGQDHAGRL